MNAKKMFGLALAAVLTVGALSGCGAKEETPAAPAPAASTPAAPAAPAAPEAALLLAALCGIAVDAACAMRCGRMDQDVDVFLVNALAALGAGGASHVLLERAGQAALAASRLARQA